MIDIEGRAAELCAAPAGCAFLLTAEESGLTPEEAAEPMVAAFLAALAVDEVRPWFGGHDRVVAMALAEGPRLLPLAHEILAQPAAAAWYGPLDRRRQQWVASPDRAASVPAPAIPRRPLSNWERYAHKPDWGLWTSTELDDAGAVTSFLACVASGTGDIAADIRPPFAGYRLGVAPTARVFEIDGPQDWRRLCMRYPSAGEDGRLVPDWAVVAEDWDGVHLSLGGLLSSEQVRVETESGWTEHWAWDAEQTVWLRDAFTDSVRLPDITELAGPPDWLRSPDALFFPPGSDSWPWYVSLGPGTSSAPLPEEWPDPEDGPPSQR